MAGKETFTRERVRLTQAHVKQAQGLIARDALDGTGVEYADTVCQGLILRVRRRSGKFILKSRGCYGLQRSRRLCEGGGR